MVLRAAVMHGDDDYLILYKSSFSYISKNSQRQRIGEEYSNKASALLLSKSIIHTH